MIMKLVICLATMGATYLGMREKVCVNSYNYSYFTVTQVTGLLGAITVDTSANRLQYA
jgi:hypothetical protein